MALRILSVSSSNLRNVDTIGKSDPFCTLCFLGKVFHEKLQHFVKFMMFVAPLLVFHYLPVHFFISTMMLNFEVLIPLEW